MLSSSIGLVSSTFPLLSFSCVKLAEVKFKENENIVFDKKENVYKLKESANSFRNYVLQNPNPIATNDEAYSIYEFEKDSKGKIKQDSNGYDIVSLDENRFPVVNEKMAPKKLKEYYEKFFNLANLLPKYTYRFHTFTPEELFEHFPHLQKKSKYNKYLGKKNVLFMSIYYVLKTDIANLKQFEKDKHSINDVGIDEQWLDKLKSAHDNVKGSLEPNIDNYDETAWPFFPMDLNVKGEIIKSYLSKNVTDPIPMIFEND